MISWRKEALKGSGDVQFDALQLGIELEVLTMTEKFAFAFA